MSEQPKDKEGKKNEDPIFEVLAKLRISKETLSDLIKSFQQGGPQQGDHNTHQLTTQDFLQGLFKLFCQSIEQKEGEKKEEKHMDGQPSPQSGSSSENESPTKIKNHFYEGRLGTAIGGALHKLGGFDEEHAISKSKVIEVGSDLTQYPLSKDKGSPKEFSESAKKALKLLIKEGIINQNDKGYYLTVKGRKEYEERSAKWGKKNKKISGTVASCGVGKQSEKQSETRVAGNAVLDLTEEEEEEEEENVKGDGPIGDKLFILAVYFLMNGNRKKNAFTKEELFREFDKVRSFSPSTTFLSDDAILEQNIHEKLIVVTKSGYTLTDDGANLAFNIISEVLTREGSGLQSKRPKHQESEDEPPKKRQKQSDTPNLPPPLPPPPPPPKTTNVPQPPSPPKTFTNVLPPPPPSPPQIHQEVSFKIPPQRGSQMQSPSPSPPPPQVSAQLIPRKLNTIKKTFLKFSMLVSEELDEDMRNHITSKLAKYNVTTSPRISTFGWCLFCNGMTKEYAINTFIVVPIEVKRDEIYESKEMDDILENTFKMGFHKVIVVGMTDKTKEKCKKYGFFFKKVSNRGSIIDFIAVKAKYISEKLGKEFNAVPFEEIQF